MMPTCVGDQAPVSLPSYYHAQAQRSWALHIDALTLVRSLHLEEFVYGKESDHQLPNVW